MNPSLCLEVQIFSSRRSKLHSNIQMDYLNAVVKYCTQLMIILVYKMLVTSNNLLINLLCCVLVSVLVNGAIYWKQNVYIYLIPGWIINFMMFLFILRGEFSSSKIIIQEITNIICMISSKMRGNYKWENA